MTVIEILEFIKDNEERIIFYEQRLKNSTNQEDIERYKKQIQLSKERIERYLNLVIK